MKKNNALMISYIAFLIISLFAQVFFKWNGLDRIAMAATIAGGFFAISDFFNWMSSFTTTISQKKEQLVDSLLESTLVDIDTVDLQNKELSNAINTFSPHFQANKDFGEWVQGTNVLIVQNNQYKKTCEETLTKCNKLYPRIQKGASHAQKEKYVETAFAILGFNSFFMTISFDYLYILFAPIQSLATIIAFVLIMLNYQLKDVYEKKKEQEIDELSEQLEEQKKNAKKNREETQKITSEFKEKSNKYQAELDKYCNIKKHATHSILEDVINGKTENAQPEQG